MIPCVAIFLRRTVLEDRFLRETPTGTPDTRTASATGSCPVCCEPLLTGRQTLLDSEPR